MSANSAASRTTRVPIREGLLPADLEALDNVRLIGTKCMTCAEVSLGTSGVCPNCGSTGVQQLALSGEGHLWTYTVVRNRPPGAYKGPEPFVPFALGLVELPEGLRVMSPLEGDIDALKIGERYRFRAFVHHVDADGREVVGFAFKALA